MISKMKSVLVAVIIIFGASGISFAMSCDMGGKGGCGEAYAQEIEKESKATDVGSKVCPVRDEEIDESAKATYEYKGKIYNFCCPMCVSEFNKDPEKYSSYK